MNTKKQFTPPSITVERFIPNEYVATCVEGFRVKCNVNGSDDTPQYLAKNDWGAYTGQYTTVQPSGNYEESNTHGSEGCGNPDKQIIQATSGGYTFYEVSGAYLLTTTLVNPTIITNPSAGMALEWITTSINDYGTRTWHHKGSIVDFVSSNHS